MFGRVRFSSDQTKNPISVMCRAGPNLLSVNDPLVAIELGLGGEAC